MTTEQKIIRAKVRLLELAKQLGNVSQAFKVVGYNRDSFYRFKELYGSARTGAARNQPQEAGHEESDSARDRGRCGCARHPATHSWPGPGRRARRVVAPRSADYEQAAQGAGSQDGSGAYPHRSATRRARKGEDRERSPWRVRKLNIPTIATPKTPPCRQHRQAAGRSRSVGQRLQRIEPTKAAGASNPEASTPDRAWRPLLLFSARCLRDGQDNRVSNRGPGSARRKSLRQSQGIRTRPQAPREPPPVLSPSARLLWDTRGRALPPPPRSPQRRQAG
jgi:hypothetical protein